MHSFPLVLAFGFLSPWMLWGLGLGSVPIVIHLLHRHRYRETTWAAMRFLTAAIRKHSQRMRLEQWVLLAVRTAILLLIALALAGPTVETLSAFLPHSGAAPTHRLIVLDASLSMSLVENGVSRFDQARDIARQLLSSSRQGDVWNLVRIGGPSPPVIIRRPTSQPDAVLRELDQLRCLEETADIAATLDEIEPLLKSAEGVPRKEIYLISDLQAANWQEAAASESAGAPRPVQRLREALRKLPDGIVHVFPVGSGDAPNAAVTSLQASDGMNLAGKTASLAIGLKRFGEGSSAQTVEFRVDDRVQETRSVTIPQASEMRLDWSPALPAGEHRLEVRLKEDNLLADNRRGAVISVRDRLPVLLVNGKPSGEPWENATDLLRLALAPDERSPFEPTVIPESELLSNSLPQFACVFLCNVALITEREASWLADYLAQGGAVVICPGGQVRLDQYNQVLLAKDRPILPAKLIERVGDPEKMTTAFEFDPGDFSHPILKPFQGNPNSGLELTKTFAYLKTEIPVDRGTRVALRFQNGDPAILTAPYGAGQVVLLTTSVDREWGTWAVWGHSFIPLMHEVVRYAAADRMAGRQVLVGQPLTGIVDSNAVRSAVVTLPGGDLASLVVADRQVAFDQTLTSGFYKLDWGPPASQSQWYAVNVDPVESDPSTWDEPLLKTEFPEAASWDFHKDDVSLPARTGVTTAAISPASLNQPWSRWLLAMAFVMLLTEQGLAWRFQFGLLALAIGAAVLVMEPMFGATITGVAALVTTAVVLLLRSRGRLVRRGIVARSH
jgi:hypothetical protein